MNVYKQLQIYYSIFSLLEHIGWLARMSVLDTEVDGSNNNNNNGSNPGCSMLFPCARHFIRIASVDSAVSTRWGQPREGCSVL